MRSMMDDFSNDYRYANEQTDSKAKVTGMCCGYHKFNKRMNDKASSVCSPAGAENLKVYIETISGDIMSLLCSNYSPESPECMSFSSHVSSIGFTSQEESSSFIPPLLVLVKNF